jgi:hypothetical protein
MTNMANSKTRRKPAARRRLTTTQEGRGSSGGALYSDVLGIAGSLFRYRQQAGADKLASFAGAARNFADDLADIPNVSGYVNMAADQMEQLSEYISDNDVEHIVEDAVHLAKTYPVSTAAFAVALGFAVTKAMTRHERNAKSVSRSVSVAGRRSKKKSSKSLSASARRLRANGVDRLHETSDAA